MLDEEMVRTQLDQVQRLDDRNKSDRDDLLGLCLDIVQDFETGGLAFVQEELDEAERLLNAQIVTAGHLTLCDYNGVSSQLRNVFVPINRQVPVAFDAMVPIWSASGEVNIRVFATLLLQGLLLLFADQDGEDVLLTVDLTRVPEMVVDDNDYSMTLTDTQQTVRLEMVHLEHFNVWANAMEQFVGVQLPDDEDGELNQIAADMSEAGQGQLDQGLFGVPGIEKGWSEVSDVTKS